jgi:hypothetical protein
MRIKDNLVTRHVPSYRRKRAIPKSALKKQNDVPHLLEVGTLASLKEAKARTEKILKFQWDFYSELSYQRNRIQKELLDALRHSTINNFGFKKWHRVVTYKYGNHPLCTNGSTIGFGGRFNLGTDINVSAPAAFPALYIAENIETAFREYLGAPKKDHDGLSIFELALSGKSSFTCVAVTGMVSSVLDIGNPKNLQLFSKYISTFKATPALVSSAKALGIDVPPLIRTAKLLQKSLLIEEWKKEPAGFDIPANSQIFGQLAFMAGIEGILYPSTKSDKKCLAIFPRNFQNSESYIKLIDSCPEIWTPTTVDATNYSVCEMSANELREKYASKGS